MTTSSRYHELPAQYDPATTEAALYREWEAAGLFVADAAASARAGGERTPFVIVMPPPNVTAVLHMGHGLNNTVQDVIIRWRRMCGDAALWVPGTDHAGIATQNVVEKQLAQEGLTRFDVGRDAFLERTTDFVAETGGVILEQLRAIGASCDWTRTAYTLSPELSRSVREAFVRLHERGLIYRGHRVIHWCPRCLTSLSDEEAEHSEQTGTLYHIRYELEPAGDTAASPASREWITVATTRPETLLGDVAVAVHPADERYAGLVGRTAILPVSGVRIPVIADAEGVDPSFGTGAVKITPAHDANDFELGVRHSLAMPVVITPDGRMHEDAGTDGRVPAAMRGMDRFDARREIVQQLERSGQLEKTEAHTHSVRRCYRCDTVVEPRLSDQWFVRMQPLAEPALKAVLERRIRLLPERWEAVYVNWLENIRDWNISRQLWWGHRIPVWYCDACGAVIASREDVEACTACGGPVRQDEDVLDTWFSSWLWPFSTLGWPDESSRDLRAFYPTDDLVTAPEILFFWVARMIMAGFAFRDEAPFHTVYLHGTVRDMKHMKMSKSLGNGIDPLDVVSHYGADALRYTVISGLGMGADLMLDPKDLEKSFAPGRNFATKLWNIGRFILSNVGAEAVEPLDGVEPARLARADRWILARLNAAIAECDIALGPARPETGAWNPGELRAGLRLSEYAESARRFVWNELADWYVESSKPRLAAGGPDGAVARAVLVHVFGSALRLLQPVVPFITQALWSRLPETAGRQRERFVAVAQWPREDSTVRPETGFDEIRNAIIALRQLRADYSIPPARLISALLLPPSSGPAAAGFADAPSAAEADGTSRRAMFADEAGFIERMARCRIELAEPDESAADVRATVLLESGWRLSVDLGSVLDVARECAKARSDLERLESQLAALDARLGSSGFTGRAPAAVIEAERDKQRAWTARREQLREKVRSLCGD